MRGSKFSIYTIFYHGSSPPPSAHAPAPALGLHALAGGGDALVDREPPPCSTRHHEELPHALGGRAESYAGTDGHAPPTNHAASELATTTFPSHARDLVLGAVAVAGARQRRRPFSKLPGSLRERS